MKFEKVLVVAAVMVVGAVAQGRAGYYGNLGTPTARGNTTVVGVVDFGTRELETKSGASQDVDTRGISLQLTHGIGHGIEFYGRVSPGTLKWEFDNSSFEPSMLSLGAGLQWAPTGQTGPLTWGLGLGLDWATGDDGPTDIDVTELSLASGVGYALDRNLSLYGGLSYISTDVTIETSGSKTDLNEHNPVGVFGGISCHLGNGFSLGAEVRLINEQVVSLLGRYSFGRRG